MTSYARAERAALADALLAAGPDAPTLCDGWATRDLAAHIVLRERRPDAAAGIMLKAAAGHTRKVQDKLAAGDWPALVERLRTGPLLLRPLDEAMNAVEFFVHHEDVRRAAPGWTPRDIPPGYAQSLAARAKSTARLSARRFPARLEVSGPGVEPFTVNPKQEQAVQVQGAPGELILFFTGRQAHADVAVTGPDDLTAKLRGARLGI
ncbi:TIGR03085 family metal-binding protein [Dactylosporangium sp. CS-047395]|uniref:TIGR03085 family metal-binding protein n=1 Tax=Dactylosporangium sp. CS-047395 TaxID=3239936 RepID=UPI003D8CDBC8